jgi:hypothetical protein
MEALWVGGVVSLGAIDSAEISLRNFGPELISGDGNFGTKINFQSKFRLPPDCVRDVWMHAYGLRVFSIKKQLHFMHP